MKKINYGRLATEQVNPRTRQIDRVTVEQALLLMAREDAAVPAAVLREKKNIARAVKLIVAELKQGGRLFFAGAGTSGRLGVIEAAECPPTFNTPPALVQAVMAGGRNVVFHSKEGAEDDARSARKIFQERLRPHDVVVGIAASGVTPFVLGALQTARARRLKTILVTCNKNLPVRNPADCVIAPVVGPEVISGSTRLKAGTATKLVLNMLTVLSMVQLGKVYENWMVDLQPKSKKLQARALRLLEHLGGVPQKNSEKVFLAAGKNVKTAILMARAGLDAPSARKKLAASSGFLARALRS